MSGRLRVLERFAVGADQKKNGVLVEYLVFPDEGHGFLKKENRIKSADAIVSFPDTRLKGKGAGAKQ